jgi:diaminopimelate dehydrogenase
MIRVAIVGYGHLGRGVESALENISDMRLDAIFTRRDPGSIQPHGGAKVELCTKAHRYVDSIDVAILCGGGASDLPVQGPEFARLFNTVDSFAIHSRIPHHFAAMDGAAREGENTSVVSTGWGAGMLSLARLFGETIIPDGTTFTFYGPGVSQGHSNVAREIEGVRDAKQYTLPIEERIDEARNGDIGPLTEMQGHRRKVYVVPEANADQDEIRQQIMAIPDYYAGFETEVVFITEEEMAEKHAGNPHSGFVLRTTQQETMEFRLDLTSNTLFTGNVLAAYARATVRLHQENRIGALTPFDVAPAYLSPKSPDKLRASLL